MFKREHPRLSSIFADTIDQTYDAGSYMTDEDFRDAIVDAMDEFLGITLESAKNKQTLSVSKWIFKSQQQAYLNFPRNFLPVP